MNDLCASCLVLLFFFSFLFESVAILCRLDAGCKCVQQANKSNSQGGGRRHIVHTNFQHSNSS